MTQRPHPYDLVRHGGRTVDWLTKAALKQTEEILGYKLTPLSSSYTMGDGGGVVTLDPYDSVGKVRALRLSGFIAYRRSRVVGGPRGYVYAVLECNERISREAEAVVFSYHSGGDGLPGTNVDPHQGHVFRGFVWPYSGLIGLARWHLEQLRAK